MLLHKPTNKIYKNRKQIKDTFGVSGYRKMISNNEIEYINNVAIDIHSNTETNIGIQK